MTYIIYDVVGNQAIPNISDQVPSKDDLICVFGSLYKVTSVVWRPTRKYMSAWIGDALQNNTITAFVWVENI